LDIIAPVAPSEAHRKRRPKKFLLVHTLLYASKAYKLYVHKKTKKWLGYFFFLALYRYMTGLWEDVSFLLSSKLSRKILECLNKAKRPISPIQIARKTGIAKGNVSTKLKHLREKALVECINPSAHKWRFYKLTERGREALAKLKATIKGS